VHTIVLAMFFRYVLSMRALVAFIALGIAMVLALAVFSSCGSDVIKIANILVAGCN
jgi:hypothetical protein